MTLEEEHEKHLQEVLANWAKVLSSLPRTKTLEDRIEKLEQTVREHGVYDLEFMKRISFLEGEVKELDHDVYDLKEKENNSYTKGCSVGMYGTAKKSCSEEMVYSVLNNLRDVISRVDMSRHTHTSMTLEDVKKLVYILEDYKRL